MFQDFEEFVALLQKNKVRCLIVGAYAVSFYASPRSTGDLDILIDPGPQNARKMLTVLKTFLGCDLGLTEKDFIETEEFIQIGVAPVRIDLLKALPGSPGFQTLWKRRTAAHFGKVPVHFIGKEDLIFAKEQAGRPKDKIDLKNLKRTRKNSSC